jgi:hypothetical protein
MVWHLFRPSEEDSPGALCPHCPERSGQRWATCAAHQERCPHCGFLCKDAHELTWIGVEMHLRAKMSTEAECRDLLGAWRCKERWRKTDPQAILNPQTKYWDGRRFRERAAFFDPEGFWLRPLRCEACSQDQLVYRSEHPRLPFYTRPTESMWNPETGAYETTCSICYAAILARKEDL